MESAAECGSALPGQITATSPQQTRTGRTLLTAILCGRGYSATCPFCHRLGRTPKKQPNPHPDVPEGIFAVKSESFISCGWCADRSAMQHPVRSRHSLPAWRKTACPGWFPGLTGRSAFRFPARRRNGQPPHPLPRPCLSRTCSRRRRFCRWMTPDSLLDSIRLDSSEETGISVRSIQVSSSSLPGSMISSSESSPPPPPPPEPLPLPLPSPSPGLEGSSGSTGAWSNIRSVPSMRISLTTTG